MKQVDIDGHKVELRDLEARQGWRILHQLGKICGQSLIEASEDRFGHAIAALFENSTAEELYSLMEELAVQITVDNNKLNLSNYGLTVKCMKELLSHNYADFFSPLEDALKGLGTE